MTGKQILIAFAVFLSGTGIAQIKVDDFIKSTEKDHTRGIQKALNHLDSLGHGSLEFSGTREYTVSASLQLPGASKSGTRRIMVINGNGAVLNAKGNISIFNRVPASQSEALDKFICTRFVIRDLQFTGGDKGINLGATYGSVIENCNFIGQNIAAIDVQFALNTTIQQCIVTNPKTDGIVVRCGTDWGGSGINSQSNHTVVSQCRVYAANGMQASFRILGSSGVVLRDVISEGSGKCAYAVYFDREKSTTVRLFTIQNFHLEHAPEKAGIYLNHTGIATIDGLYYQLAYAGFALVEAAAGAEQITLRNVPHFVSGTILRSGNNEVPWRLEFCDKSFYVKESWRVKMKDGEKPQLPFYFSGIGGKYQIKKQY